VTSPEESRSRARTSDAEQRVPIHGGTITLADLRARCSVLEPGIVQMREIPNGSVDAFIFMVDHCYTLGAAFDRFAFVIDLAEATVRPSGKYLEEIWRGFRRGAIHHAYIQPGSGFMRAVLRFVLGRAKANTSVHGTQAEAIAAARRAIDAFAR
jgi:hypothetical protein